MRKLREYIEVNYSQLHLLVNSSQTFKYRLFVKLVKIAAKQILHFVKFLNQGFESKIPCSKEFGTFPSLIL